MIDIVRASVVPAAYAVLPPGCASPMATRLLLAIGWQESRFLHRRQIGGPALGFWQFELGGGVKGVLNHPTSKAPVRDALAKLKYPSGLSPFACHSAIEHNDVLAAVFARLLLWTLPGAIASTEAQGWTQYLEAWRPGKPHHGTWAEAWSVAA